MLAEGTLTAEALRKFRGRGPYVLSNLKGTTITTQLNADCDLFRLENLPGLGRFVDFSDDFALRRLLGRGRQDLQTCMGIICLFQSRARADHVAPLRL